MKILIVEDDPRIAEVIADAVMALRIPIILIEPVVCDNVADALALIRAPDAKFLAVVLDMGLPEKAGRGAAPKGGVYVWNAIREKDREAAGGRRVATTPIVINTGLEHHHVAKWLDDRARYSPKDTMTVVKHLEEMLK